MGAISPGQIAFNYPDQHYGSHEEYLRRARRRAVVRVQGDHRRGLQPADRLARHGDGRALPLGRQQRRRLAPPPAARGRRAERGARGHPAGAGRASTSAGATTAARTTRTSRSQDIIGRCCKVNAGTIYVEGANPRHAHEWRVFEDVPLPDDKSVILGVIDVKSNCIEHPRLVADRLVQLGEDRRQGARCSPAPTAASTPSSASRWSTRRGLGEAEVALGGRGARLRRAVAPRQPRACLARSPSRDARRRAASCSASPRRDADLRLLANGSRGAPFVSVFARYVRCAVVWEQTLACQLPCSARTLLTVR